MKVSALIRAIGWSSVYLIGGFSAPFIFKAAPDPVSGGHVAGSLFMIAGLWAVLLSFKHELPMAARFAFVIFVILEGVFWSWRFLITTPLRESSLIGLSGGAWHGILTMIYVALALLLVGLEYRRLALT